MKHLRFIGFFTLMFVNPVLAETVSCINGVREDGITACDKCGDNCDWKIENGKLSISGGGNMIDYYFDDDNGRHAKTRPWDNYLNSISEVDVKGISHVGDLAFMSMGLQNVSFSDSVKSIGGSSFSGNHISVLQLPDSIESVGGWAFSSNSLDSVILPDSLKTIGDAAFENNSLSSVVIPDTLSNTILRSFGTNLAVLQNLTIECKGNNTSCEKINKLLKNYAYGYKNKQFIYMDLSDRLFALAQQHCDSTNFYWNGVECVREPDVSKRTCCPVCVDLDGYCSRIRYTLPEADAATSNDNENMIEWIFE